MRDVDRQRAAWQGRGHALRPARPLSPYSIRGGGRTHVRISILPRTDAPAERSMVRSNAQARWRCGASRSALLATAYSRQRRAGAGARSRRNCATWIHASSRRAPRRKTRRLVVPLTGAERDSPSVGLPSPNGSFHTPVAAAFRRREKNAQALEGAWLERQLPVHVHMPLSRSSARRGRTCVLLLPTRHRTCRGNMLIGPHRLTSAIATVSSVGGEIDSR
jgi:hypothetical protein